MIYRIRFEPSKECYKVDILVTKPTNPHGVWMVEDQDFADYEQAKYCMEFHHSGYTEEYHAL